MNKNVWSVSIALLFLIIPSIVQATKSEFYNGLITIAVEAPNEVKPGEEFQIFFKIYPPFRDVFISHIRVELWAMGNYKRETLLKSCSLKRMGMTTRNMTFVLEPAPPYPNIVLCDLWILCREEGAEDQFSHCRFTISWCISSTYDELIADYDNLNATYYELESNYTELQENFDSLQNSCDDLEEKHNALNFAYNNLQANYELLNSTYHELLRNCSELLADYNSLNYTYNNLNAIHNELKTEQDATTKELNGIRNLMYIFIATTIVFIATTVYFAKRKTRS